MHAVQLERAKLKKGLSWLERRVKKQKPQEGRRLSIMLLWSWCKKKGTNGVHFPLSEGKWSIHWPQSPSSNYVWLNEHGTFCVVHIQQPFLSSSTSLLGELQTRGMAYGKKSVGRKVEQILKMVRKEIDKKILWTHSFRWSPHQIQMAWEIQNSIFKMQNENKKTFFPFWILENNRIIKWFKKMAQSAKESFCQLGETDCQGKNTDSDRFLKWLKILDAI